MPDADKIGPGVNMIQVHSNSTIHLKFDCQGLQSFVVLQCFIVLVQFATGLCSGGIMAALLPLIAELLPAKGRGFYLTVWCCGRPMSHGHLV